MNGFNGFEIQKVNGEYIQPKFGFNGLQIEKVNKQYILPIFGFDGIQITMPISPKLKKIIKY